MIFNSLAQYNLEYAVLLNGTDSFFSKTFGAPTNNRKWTLSFWAKRSELGTYQQILSATASGNEDCLRWHDTTDVFEFYVDGEADGHAVTDGVQKDVGDWAHYVVVADYANNNGFIYMNGVLASSMEHVFIDQDNDTNSAVVHNIGRYLPSTNSYVDGYIADLYFIDGQALDHTSFSTTADNGDHVAKAYEGTYGNNGFHLDFSDDSGANTLGLDSSGKNNHWVENGTIVQVTDTPTNNACVISPIHKHPSWSGTLSEGNLRLAGGNYTNVGTLLLPKTGDWQWEYLVNATVSVVLPRLGIVGKTSTFDDNLDLDVDGYGVEADGRTFSEGSNGSAYDSYGATDVVTFYYKADDDELYYAVNGDVVNSGVPSTGTNPTWTLDGTRDYLVALQSATTSNVTARFTDIDYPLVDFNYLTENNLPTVDEDLADHWATVLYTGNGTSIDDPTPGTGGKSVTGVGFQPDFVWIKNRTSSYSNALYDTIRGENNSIYSDGSWAELNQAESLCSFDADGFTVGSYNEGNILNNEYVAWCASLPNTVSSWDVSVTATMDSEIYNATLGMSIVKANVSASDVIGHTGGKVPFMIINKDLDTSNDWIVWHSAIHATSGNTGRLKLNDPAIPVDGTFSINAVGTDTFTLGSSSNWGGDNIFYIFYETDFCKPVNYTGNTSADGAFANLGISPEWSMVKRNTSGYSWIITDAARDESNPVQAKLAANSALEENNAGPVGPASANNIDYVSTGIKTRDTNGSFNGAAVQYIGVAIGRPTQAAKAR